MKKLFYSFIAVFALLLTGCADKDVVESGSTDDNKPGILVSVSMEGDMGQTAPVSRAIGYETRNDGFPTPVGIFNDNGTSELADGTKVPVLLIFRSSDKNQPITKVVTKWTYKKGGNLTLEPSEKFEMVGGTDLSVGTWYVCGILGGTFDKTADQVKFDGYVGEHAVNEKWAANIPYIFGWRKLITNKAKSTIKADEAVKFKQFGSIVRLNVTNNTGFNFKYNGVRLITSNILCGQFDLKSFNEKDNTTDGGVVEAAKIKDTKDADIAFAKSNSYKETFEAFKFYQRDKNDATITQLASTNRFRIYGDYVKNYTDEKAKKLNTALYYYDHSFKGNNFEKVDNGKEAASYVYVWMAPQEQAIKIYNGNKEGDGAYTTKKVAKTQFMLMAVPEGNSSSGKVVPTSINMLPAYGTLTTYNSGSNYPAKGKVVYNFAPLSYIAKRDNFGSASDLATVAANGNTRRYYYTDILSNLPSIPSDYQFANHEYWRCIIPQFYGFSGFRTDNSGNLRYNFSMGFVSPAKHPEWSETKLVFHSYSKGVKVNGKTIAYMLGMSKAPDYITNTGEGQAYQGYAKVPLTGVSSGLNVSKWVENNDYRYTIRWEDKNGAAVLTQRYLGPRFVLDMDDIDNEDFWAAPNNSTTYPTDVTRIFPYTGINNVVQSKPTRESIDQEGQTWWYFDNSSVGKCTQYWTPDDALSGGRYFITTNTGGYQQDSQQKAPKQSVTFKGPSDQENVSCFMNYYLYVNPPYKQNEDPRPYVNDSRYQKNYRSAAPVRLWRKSTPLAD